MNYLLLGQLLAVVPLTDAAADWDAAIIARQHRDFATTNREIRPDAEAGAADAQDVLGKLLLLGQGVARDDAAAAEWFRRSAENGYLGGMADYAFVLSRGRGVPRDEPGAVQWLTRAAMGGDPSAMVHLAECQQQGIGTARNIVAAHDWYLKAANAGSADGMLHLAILLLSPIEGATDEPAGIDWMTKAAQAGYPAAQVRLAGIQYFGQHGVAKNEASALEWALKAAPKDRDGAALLGLMYLRGAAGHPANIPEALRWTKLAAQKGVAEAAVELAGLYLDGRGTPRDPIEAYFWALVGAGHVRDELKQRADRVVATAAERLTPKQQEEVKRRAAAWQPDA
jgi:TPR repeat protein